MNDIRTYSYSCERPECIKAQRDELVVRLEAQRDQASGSAEYLAYLEAAVDEAGFVIKHDGGTLGNSNFRLEPRTQPIAAQEAVAWLSKDDAQLALFKAIQSIKLGNPTDDKLILANLREAGLWIGRYESAPVTAAPGIDLEQFREAVEYRYSAELAAFERGCRSEGHLERAEAERRRLLALIDASPKE